MSDDKPIPIARKSHRATAARGAMQAPDSVIASEVEAESPTADRTHDAAAPMTAGILHNAHDADLAAARVEKVIAALGARGLPVDITAIDARNLRARADAFAACRLLIQKGIATEAEVATEAFQALEALLLAVLAHVERESLTAGQVQAVRKPGLVVARQ